MGFRHRAVVPGRARIFEDTANLRPGEIHAQQRMHQPNALRVPLEMTQIAAHVAAQGVKRFFTLLQAQRLHRAAVLAYGQVFGISRKEPLAEPVVNRGLTEVAERRIADVMHQARHLDNTFKRPGQLRQAIRLKQPLLFQAAQHFFGDIAPHLLHFQRVRKARAHRGVALKGKNLGFLLQAADRGRVDNTAAIAFKNTQDLVFTLHALRRAIPAMPVDFVSEIDFLHPPSRSARTRIKSLLSAMIDYASESII